MELYTKHQTGEEFPINHNSEDEKWTQSIPTILILALVRKEVVLDGGQSYNFLKIQTDKVSNRR